MAIVIIAGADPIGGVHDMSAKNYTVIHESGETWTMRADFGRASCPLVHVDDDGYEYGTPYQVADARHYPARGAELIAGWWGDMGPIMSVE